MQTDSQHLGAGVEIKLGRVQTPCAQMAAVMDCVMCPSFLSCVLCFIVLHTANAEYHQLLDVLSLPRPSSLFPKSLHVPDTAAADQYSHDHWSWFSRVMPSFLRTRTRSSSSFLVFLCAVCSSPPPRP